MPNQPRPDNPVRPVRVEDDLWNAALEKARTDGTTVSQIIRTALRRYVFDSDPTTPNPQQTPAKEPPP